MALDNHNQRLEPWLRTFKNKVDVSASNDLNVQKGWEQLSKELPIHPRFTLLHSSLYRAGGIAAVFIVAIGLATTFWIYQNRDRQPLSSPNVSNVVIADNNSLSNNTPSIQVENEKLPSYPVQEKPKTLEGAVIDKTIEQKNPLQEEETAQETSASTTDKVKDTTSHPSTNHSEIGVIPPPSNRKDEESFSKAREFLAYEEKLSIQAYANTATSQRSQAYTPNQTLLRTSQLRQLANANSSQYNYDRATFTHAQPFNVGFRFSYSLNPILSIESGLSYTLLSARISNLGAIAHAKQQIHYLGIPLGVRFQLAEFKGIQLYTGSNVQVDRMFAAKIDKEYLSEKAWQLSLHGRIGVGYAITPNVSLFAEGGLSYYFNDGSRLHTYYKEHPLTFSFSSGIRFDY